MGALALVASCSLPMGDQATPESAHYAILRARQAGDVDTLWMLLDPAAVDLFDRWVKAEKKSVEAIRLRYKDVTNPELPREYLEKIVQVPVRVPTANGSLARYPVAFAWTE